MSALIGIAFILWGVLGYVVGFFVASVVAWSPAGADDDHAVGEPVSPHILTAAPTRSAEIVQFDSARVMKGWANA